MSAAPSQLSLEDAMTRRSAPPRALRESKAWAYLAEHPEVYERFEREALKVWRAGWKHYSARTIAEVLRHRSALEADHEGRGYKINNNLIPVLAREFLRRNPQCGPDFFHTRRA